jgi:hypothetical protein
MATSGITDKAVPLHDEEDKKAQPQAGTGWQARIQGLVFSSLISLNRKAH